MANFSYTLDQLKVDWYQSDHKGKIPFKYSYCLITLPDTIGYSDRVILPDDIILRVPFKSAAILMAQNGVQVVQQDFEIIRKSGCMNYRSDDGYIAISGFSKGEQGGHFDCKVVSEYGASGKYNIGPNQTVNTGYPPCIGVIITDASKKYVFCQTSYDIDIGIQPPTGMTKASAESYIEPTGETPGTCGVFNFTCTFNVNILKYNNWGKLYSTDNQQISYIDGVPYDPDDPNPGDGDSHGGGGGGTDDLGGDPIKDTGVPTIEATDSGLMTLYNPTVSELQALGRFLWSDGLDLNSFKKLFNDPFDTLLGLSIIPIVPPTSGAKNIMFGNLDSGVSAKVISHQFVPNVDMGSVTLGEVYNGALDYSPFTTVSIYLPFIGYRELNVQDIMNSKIHLVYKFDVLTGGCIAELYVDHLKTGNKSKDNSKFRWESHSGLLASFEGQCAVNIPLASQDYTNTIRAMIGAVGMVGGAAASFATGNPALGVAALAVGTANSAMQASTPTVQRSGHLSSSNAIMANLTPFLTVTRPHQCKPSKYYKLRGVPSQIYVSKLSNLTTSKHDYYLQVAEIPDIKVAGATDTEIAEIKNLLKEGVVL